MDVFFEPFQEILRTLNSFEIEYLVIGGYAVNFYGYNRTTSDMDLWINPSLQNKNRFLEMLREKDFEAESINFIEKLDFSQAEVFSLGEAPFKIDLLTKVSLLDFAEAYARKKIENLDGTQIPFIHFNDLILSKINTNRLKDKADVEELQRIKNEKKE